MAGFDKTMVKKGSENSTGAVLEQGEKTSGNTTRYLDQLCKAGLPTDTPTVMKALLADVLDKSSARSAGREELNSAGSSEAAERSGAKRFIRRTRNAAKLVLKKGPVKGVSPTAFAIGQMGRSTSELIVQLTDLRPHVATLDEELKTYFEQQSPVVELDSISKRLSAVGGQRDTTFDALPLGTLALYEARGKVVDLVERINLVANIAFDGQAEIRAVFNKDILLRDRRSSKRKGKTAEQPAETPAVVAKPA